MNIFEHYSTNDDIFQDNVALAPWPNSPWAMEDYSYTPESVPQSTHPALTPAPGYIPTVGQHLSDFNAAGHAAFTLAPTTEMGMFTNLPTTQVDYTDLVSNQHIWTRRQLTYPAAPQNAPDPWVQTPSMFLPCIIYDPLYSPDADPKLSSMPVPRFPRYRRLATLIMLGSLPLPPTRRRRHRK